MVAASKSPELHRPAMRRSCSIPLLPLVSLRRCIISSRDEAGFIVSVPTEQSVTYILFCNPYQHDNFTYFGGIWNTFVRVPVLSEQMTDTAPRVSTVFKDLQRILFLRMRLAVMVRLAVKAIGRPSGMKAIATLTQSTIRVGTLIQSG
jgi:hypothetical protein